MTRAVFFDRDGTLMEEVHYCSDPRLVKLYPGAREALGRLKDAGFGIYIITNQSGIGRGLMTLGQYEAVEAEFERQLGPGLLDGAYYCPDAPDTPSTRRKPEPGMVLEAAAEHAIDLTRSYFVGDKSADIECGRRAGTQTILVMTGYGSQQDCVPTFRAATVGEAVQTILDDTRNDRRRY